MVFMIQTELKARKVCNFITLGRWVGGKWLDEDGENLETLKWYHSKSKYEKIIKSNTTFLIFFTSLDRKKKQKRVKT